MLEGEGVIMAIFASQYLMLENRLEEMGTFDSLMDEDSNYFINIKLLKDCNIPEFSTSYCKINDFFAKIGTLLKLSKTSEDRTYKTAYKLFDFSEVNGINLGFSESKFGAGFGKELRKRIIADAYEIIHKGSEYPEIFQLVSLFEDNVGPDRLSDMIATIIYSDIVNYTIRINQELSITPENYNEVKFEDGLVINPYKDCPLLLLPIEILHELPIARDWDDIDRVARENDAIKKEINEVVCEQWKKIASSEKKEYLKEHIFMVPEKCARIIEAYNSSDLPVYDIYQNSKYNSIRIFEKIMLPSVNFANKDIQKKVSSMKASKDILEIFKHWIEYNGGNNILLETDTRSREKVCQRLVHLSAKSYIEVNKLDFSCEANEGRGPVDFKISNGDDKTVIEVKLSSNQQYLHGLQVQIEEYASAERTDNKIYVFVDIGNPGRLKTIQQEHADMLSRQENPAELFIIDAVEKQSASVYK